MITQIVLRLFMYNKGYIDLNYMFFCRMKERCAINIITVDDEQLALDNITNLLSSIVPEANITSFQKAEDALAYLVNNRVDIAFLDIKIGDLDGIYLAKKCKEIYPYINIIFVTGYDQYAMEALKLHASGYLLKPVRKKDVLQELDNLRKPIKPATNKRVRILTFGNFEIFVDNKPLHFPMARCKESLAYLIDRKGAFITTGELAGILWEDKPYDKTVQNNTHRVISDMLRTLKEAGIRDIIIKRRREMSIVIEKVDCDYYAFLNGDVTRINMFRGEYMSNYSWAEFTLSNIKEDTDKNYV